MILLTSRHFCDLVVVLLTPLFYCHAASVVVNVSVSRSTILWLFFDGKTCVG